MRLQPLDVDRERVEEDVRQRMAGDLRQVRVVGAGRALARWLLHAAGADDQDPLGAEVHRRRDRRGLAHRAVAAVLVTAVDVERDRRKHERDRRRREQVLDPDLRAHREALRARPGHDVVEGVVEGDVQARAVARGRHRQRVQVALAHHLVQPLGADQLAEQRLERLVVEQRARPGPAPAGDHPADRHHRQPASAGADHADRVGAIHLLGAEVLPDLDDAGDRPRRNRRPGRRARRH